ncbi:MAG: glycosyltransferase [Deltaproteobacteria bacterium]|nr:glycosyltransferase [Deltaproteobacteria bacterium]
MKIAYLLETTGLCGGVKVVFNHVRALNELGEEAAVLAREPYPDWLTFQVPFRQVASAAGFAAPELTDYEIVVATSPLHLVSVYAEMQGAGRGGRLVHFVQGYEGDYPEAEPFQELIDSAYRLPVPRVTLTPELAARLRTRYPRARFACCGQGLEGELFHPAADLEATAGLPFADRLVVVGPLDISIKKIPLALEAYRLAAAERPELKLIRVSSVDTRERELALAGAIAEYHVRLLPAQVAALFRRPGSLFLSSSSAAEGFGLPALEALACGLPAVLTDIPSYRAFGGPGGVADYAFFVPAGDVQAMAAAVLRLAADRRLRKKLAARGCQVAGGYSYEKVAARMKEFFQWVCRS